MSANPFEYEERYKATNPDAVCRALEAAGFVEGARETQTDHWFIPQRVMTSEQQSQWFDHEHGYALRIRELVAADGAKTIVTSKQLLNEADHSAMTNNEAPLSAAGMSQVLAPIGEEFSAVTATLAASRPDLNFNEAKQLIKRAGRKEYITIQKQRRTFRSAGVPDVVIDIDSIPALQNTALGFWSSIEFEYVGLGTPDEARRTIRNICDQLGYTEQDMLAKALPGLAIPYLAQF